MKLLLDLGNTRLKWALAHSPDDRTAHGAIDWHSISSDTLSSAWRGLPSPSVILGASVVDVTREQQIDSIVSHLFECPITWLRTPAQACGIRNAYDEPQRLGVDRFLAMVAAKADGKAPCILASIGTALTLDALAGDGLHLGGWIAPGPQLMQRSLFDATARVRLEDGGHIVDAADNTIDAVTSGCWHAAAALIERFHLRMQARFDRAPTLLLSGGDASMIMPLLSMPAEEMQNSVLRGLAVWANAQRGALPSV